MELFTDRRFLPSVKIHFVYSEYCDEARAMYGSKHYVNPILDDLNTKFRCMYTPQYYASVDDSLTAWKIHVLSKCVKFVFF
jgi:hypothetical protein